MIFTDKISEKARHKALLFAGLNNLLPLNEDENTDKMEPVPTKIHTSGWRDI